MTIHWPVHACCLGECFLVTDCGWLALYLCTAGVQRTGLVTPSPQAEYSCFYFLQLYLGMQIPAGFCYFAKQSHQHACYLMGESSGYGCDLEGLSLITNFLNSSFLRFSNVFVVAVQCRTLLQHISQWLYYHNKSSIILNL